MYGDALVEVSLDVRARSRRVFRVVHGAVLDAIEPRRRAATKEIRARAVRVRLSVPRSRADSRANAIGTFHTPRVGTLGTLQYPLEPRASTPRAV